MPADRPQQNEPRRGPKTPPGKRGFLPRNPFLVIALILGVVLIVQLWFDDSRRLELPYSTLEDLLVSMPVADAHFLPPTRADAPKVTAPKGDKKAPLIDKVKVSGMDLTGIINPTEALLKGHSKKKPRWRDYVNKKNGTLPFTCKITKNWEKLRERLLSRGVSIKNEEPRDFSFIFIWLLPILFLVFIVMMMFRSSRMTGENVLSFGRSRAKIVGEDKTGVTFADVAGAGEAKEELGEIVEFLKEPERFTVLGGKIPKGCLLVGPPGCGKTLLARAVAGEAAVPFFSISGSDFVEMFVGVGAARVRDMFSTAKQKAPCIVFVDEIDAVGRHRGTGLGGGHDEREQTLNQLLVEMDGFDGRKGVIVIAATNRPDILDPALLRPGRFDRHVVLDAPDLVGREAILRIHSNDKPLDKQVDLREIAQRTPGFTGADLANVMNEAALLAARRRLKAITTNEVLEAVERVVAGPERHSRVIGSKEKKVLAYHELGHALVARFSEQADTVHKVSIIPRGKGLGYTLTLPSADRYIVTKDELLARIRVSLGGRSAEEVVFGEQSTGAADDLEKVSELAHSLVCRWGMTEELGPVAYSQPGGNPFLGRELTRRDHISEQTAAAIDRQVREIIEKCHQEAKQIIMRNRELLEKMAEVLIAKETLDRVEFEDLVQKYATQTPPPLPEPPFQKKDVPLQGETGTPDAPPESGQTPLAETPGSSLPPPHPAGA